MGNWNITIQGHGIHDNGLPNDADNMMLDFIKQLEAEGHVVEGAYFTVGYAREYKSAQRDYVTSLTKNIKGENL